MAALTLSSRRKFLRNTALAAGACMIHRPARAAQAAQDEILGQGNYRYKAVPGWGVLDRRTPVNDCHGMAEDKRGRILLLTNESRNNVIIYDKGGKLLGTWGHDFPGAHGFKLVNENGEELLFITDYDRHQVFKTTLDGRILMTLSAPFECPTFVRAEQYKPTDVIAAPNGDFYVLDGYGTSLILHYSHDGQFKNAFGGRGGGPANVNEVHGGTIDPRDPANPTLLVTSRQDCMLKRFTLDGKYVESIPLPNSLPCNVVFKGDAIYIPQLRMKDGKSTGFLTVMDLKNRVVSNPGGAPPVYAPDGTLQPLERASTLFTHPHGIVLDEEESIYVAQWASGQTYPIKLARV
jgi:hypothetical protein